MKKVLIVTTSIGDERVVRRFLGEYSRVNPDGFKAKLLIVGDRKTPQIDFSRLPEYDAFVGRGFEFEYLDAADQEDIMESATYMEDLIPWNRTTRRNIGYLTGYRDGYDAIITVDDDNYPTTAGFLKSHMGNLSPGPVDIIEPSDGRLSWFNPCAFMEHHIVPRGYPVDYRYKSVKTRKTRACRNEKVVVSAGFWLGDPDIDALTRVEGNPENTKVGRIKLERNFCLSPSLLAPFNSQNTAFVVDATPALFLSAKIGRYDDIWAGYVLRALMCLTGDVVMYGRPFVRQERNAHDLISDLEKEIYGMRNTLPFVNELMQGVERLGQRGKGGGYLELTRLLCEDLYESSRDYRWYHEDMLRWLDMLGGRRA